MRNKTIAITGAARGLGAALAIVAADRGARPILLGRSLDGLGEVAKIIESRTGTVAPAIRCDLADLGSVAEASDVLAREHSDLDILVNSGSQWVGGPFEAMSDEQIAAVIGSTATGTIALTRRILPQLKARERADIHMVVSMSGLPYARLRGSALPFRAAKAAQDGFAQGLVEELIGTNVRVTSIYPGIIEDVLPMEAEWDRKRGADEGLTNRDVVDGILFALSAPPNVAFRQIVVERTKTDFLS